MGSQKPNEVAGQPNRKQRRAAVQVALQEAESSQTDIADVVFQIAASLPHAPQIRMRADDGTMLWGTLRETDIVGNASDLFLKHGRMVAGNWTIVGIVDALPELDQNGQLTQDASDTLANASEFEEGVYGTLVKDIWINVRQQFGRPFGSFGVTPLMLFREITSLPVNR